MMTEEYLTQSWRCECGTFVSPADGGICPCGMLHPDHPLNDDANEFCDEYRLQEDSYGWW